MPGSSHSTLTTGREELVAAAYHIAAFHSFFRAVDRFAGNAGLFGHFLSECSAVFDVGAKTFTFLIGSMATHISDNGRAPARPIRLTQELQSLSAP